VEIYHFIPDSEHYFGGFLPTLRSIALSSPCGSHRQLSYFLSLFPNLDDVEVCAQDTCHPKDTVSNAQLVSISTPKLRGRLALFNFYWVETWTHLIALCGLRFRHMDLRGSIGCAPVLLRACAETLETLRFNATEGWLFCLDISTDLS